MSGSDSAGRQPTYDRQLLLGADKRNTVLELWEVATATAMPITCPSTACPLPFGMRRGSGCWVEPPSNALTMHWVKLSEVRQSFDWSTVHVYSLTAAGTNHGVLLGTRGWVP